MEHVTVLSATSMRLVTHSMISLLMEKGSFAQFGSIFLLVAFTEFGSS